MTQALYAHMNNKRKNIYIVVTYINIIIYLPVQLLYANNIF
jgi:hypothetical protein